MVSGLKVWKMKMHMYIEVNVWRSGLATLPQDFMPCPYEQVAVGLKWNSRNNVGTKAK